MVVWTFDSEGLMDFRKSCTGQRGKHTRDETCCGYPNDRLQGCNLRRRRKRKEAELVKHRREGRTSVRSSTDSEPRRCPPCKRPVLRWWMVHPGHHLQRGGGCAVLIWAAGAKLHFQAILNTEQSQKPDQPFWSRWMLLSINWLCRFSNWGEPTSRDSHSEASQPELNSRAIFLKMSFDSRSSLLVNVTGKWLGIIFRRSGRTFWETWSFLLSCHQQLCWFFSWMKIAAGRPFDLQRKLHFSCVIFQIELLDMSWNSSQWKTVNCLKQM